jgi:hypothetical protein
LAVDFLKQNPDADFTTCYEHPDLYTTDLHRFAHQTREFGGRKWSSSMSTTHAFLARRSALIEIHWIFQKLFRAFRGKTSPDLGMWMALTKKRVYNPMKVVSWVVPHWHWGGSILCAWYFCWRQILFGRRYTLWTPHPSMATHMVASQLAPGIDWHNEFQRQITSEKTVHHPT